MNNISIKNDDVRPDVDALLTEFFQNEVPQPWPAFQTPVTTRVKERPAFWSRSGGRLALAASIALLIGGYLSLGGFFPRSQGTTGVESVAPDTAKGFDKLHKRELPKAPPVEAVPMPMGQIN